MERVVRNFAFINIVAVGSYVTDAYSHFINHCNILSVNSRRLVELSYTTSSENVLYSWEIFLSGCLKIRCSDNVLVVFSSRVCIWVRRDGQVTQKGEIIDNFPLSPSGPASLEPHVSSPC